jgi:hypothetical protein
MGSLRHLLNLVVIVVGAVIVWNELRDPARQRSNRIGAASAGAAGGGATAPAQGEDRPPSAPPPASSPPSKPAAAGAQPGASPTDAAITETSDDAAMAAEVPEGAVAGSGERECPPDYPIKGNASSMIYHQPGLSSFERTIPDFCFATPEAAEAAGYRPPLRG